LKEILLITGKDCHLCSEARSLLLSIQTDNFEFREVDIYSKRAYVDKYWDKIPVILKQESELLWPFNIEDLKKFLITDIKKFQ
tara:strand:+ start:227 stop:475 length:249 start_codon:yes stop_codon:yes gene_type:complete